MRQHVARLPHSSDDTFYLLVKHLELTRSRWPRLTHKSRPAVAILTSHAAAAWAKLATTECCSTDVLSGEESGHAGHTSASKVESCQHFVQPIQKTRSAPSSCGSPSSPPVSVPTSTHMYMYHSLTMLTMFLASSHCTFYLTCTPIHATHRRVLIQTHRGKKHTLLDLDRAVPSEAHHLGDDGHGVVFPCTSTSTSSDPYDGLGGTCRALRWTSGRTWTTALTRTSRARRYVLPPTLSQR
jgi:hypothetical protein